MIHKVSGSNTQMDLFAETTYHQSMNKSAMTSFEKIMVAAANKLLKEGQSLADVAKSFGMTEAELKVVVASQETVKTASAEPVEKTASAEPKSDPAQAAYNALHGVSDKQDSDYQPRNGRSIHSAMGNQSVSDVGCPKGQIRYHNSIFDSEVLKRQAEKKTGDEIIKESRAAEDARRETIRKQAHEIDPEAVKHAMGRAEISNMSGNDGYKFSQKLPKRGISIFDSGEFERIPEKTAGELEVALKRAAKKPEREVTADIIASQKSSQSITNAMIEGMLKIEEPKKE